MSINPHCSDVAALQQRLDRVIDDALAAQRIVGTVVLVRVQGETLYRRAAGYADREAGVTMQENAVFRLASISKLIVATTAMALVSKGVLDLETPIQTWLPDFAPTLPDGRQASITIRQLLSHSAGLSYGFLEPSDGPYHRAGVSDGMDRVNFSLTENLRRLASVPLLFTPGSAWNYSLSMDVLGAIIKRVTGKSLSDVVREAVSDPLQLKDTGFQVHDATRLVTAYADGLPSPRRMQNNDALPFIDGFADVLMSPIRAFDRDAFPSGGAGMIGSADDILTLLEVLRQGGAPLLSESWVTEMGCDQIPDLPVAGWPGWGYGLGFSVLRDPALAGTAESVGTWRWGGAYGHSWFVDPVQQLSVVAMTNTAFEGMSGGGRFPQDLCRAVYGV